MGFSLPINEFVWPVVATLTATFAATLLTWIGTRTWRSLNRNTAPINPSEPAEELTADDQLWVEVKQKGKPEDYAYYLASYPLGRFAKQADDYLWAIAEASGISAGYELYISRVPNGSRRPLAEYRAKQLKLEENLSSFKQEFEGQKAGEFIRASVVAKKNALYEKFGATVASFISLPEGPIFLSPIKARGILKEVTQSFVQSVSSDAGKEKIRSVMMDWMSQILDEVNRSLRAKCDSRSIRIDTNVSLEQTDLDEIASAFLELSRAALVSSTVTWAVDLLVTPSAFALGRVEREIRQQIKAGMIGAAPDLFSIIIERFEELLSYQLRHCVSFAQNSGDCNL